MFCLIKLKRVLFHRGLLSFKSVPSFYVLLSPEGSGNKELQNITAHYVFGGFEVLVCFYCFLSILLLLFLMLLSLLASICAQIHRKPCSFEWMVVFYIEFCFIRGLLSFNTLFVFCWSPEGFENKAFQNITAKWTKFVVWGFCFFLFFLQFCWWFLLCCHSVGLNLSKYRVNYVIIYG